MPQVKHWFTVLSFDKDGKMVFEGATHLLFSQRIDALVEKVRLEKAQPENRFCILPLIRIIKDK